MIALALICRLRERQERITIKATAIKIDWEQIVDDLQSPAKSVGFILEQMGVTEGFQHKN